QRGSDIGADLPGVLAELSLRRRGKRERRACSEHEPPTAQRTPRGNPKDGVAEPVRSFTVAVLIELGQGIDHRDDWTHVEPPLVAECHTQQRLKHQVALHPISGFERHVNPIVVLLYLHQPTTGERIGCLLGHCGGRLIPIPSYLCSVRCGRLRLRKACVRRARECENGAQNRYDVLPCHLPPLLVSTNVRRTAPKGKGHAFPRQTGLSTPL